MFWGRIISVLAPLCSMVLLAGLFQTPDSFYYYFIVSLVVSGLAMWRLTLLIKPQLEIKQKIYYLGYALLLIAGFVGVFILLENVWLKWLLWLATAILLIFYFNKIFKIAVVSFGAPDIRWKFFDFYEAIIIFFASTFLFGLRDLLSTNLLWLIIIIAVAAFLLPLISISLSNNQKKEGVINYSWVFAIASAEIFWGISALSPAYYLKSFLFTAIYLLMLSWRQSIISEDYAYKYFKIHLFFILFIVALVLLTAKWF